MTPVQTANMIRGYLDRIQHYAKHAYREVSTVHGISMPECRAHQELQFNLQMLFESCEVLRTNLQDERSDLAPPTREEMIVAVMSAVLFRERRNAFGDVTLVCSVTFERAVQLTREAEMRTDVDLKDRLRRQLAEKVMSSLSAKELQRMVDWHRERLATAAMQADPKTEESGR
jgi:hypothetical protein